MKWKKEKESEHEIQAAFFEYVRLKAKKDNAYKLVTAIPNAREGEWARIRFWREGVNAGWPDVLCAAPRGKWNALFIEFKTRTGRLSRKQLEIMACLQKAGACVLVCYSADEGISLLDQYLKIDGASNAIKFLKN